MDSVISSVSVPWGVEIALISWRTVAKKHRPPLPSELLATFVAFGAFGIVSTRAPKVGSALGWGIVVATFLNLFDPTNPTAAFKGATTTAQLAGTQPVVTAQPTAPVVPVKPGGFGPTTKLGKAQ